MEYGLLFYFSEDFTESDVASLQQMIAGLASARQWIAEPPQFIDHTEDVESNADQPVRTVGGFLRLPHPDDVSDRQTEREHYEEVVCVINALSAFTADSECEFELELGGTYVGDIANGKPNQLVAVGLLDEWRKAL
jgi:hypothetical protein